MQINKSRGPIPFANTDLNQLPVRVVVQAVEGVPPDIQTEMGASKNFGALFWESL